MRSNWKVLGLFCIPVLALLSTGCSGINASQSVSPATFLLPGLLKADPPTQQPEHTVPTTEPGTEVARL